MINPEKELRGEIIKNEKYKSQLNDELDKKLQREKGNWVDKRA